MALLSSCCLNLSPPTADSNSLPSSSSTTTRTNQVSKSLKKNERSWGRKCAVSMSTVMVALQLIGNNNDFALALDHHRLSQPDIVIGSFDVRKIARWSDKRACPPWQLNSLETIVPENLPRPAARRRSEAVAISRNAPTAEIDKVIVVVGNGSKCFSL